jgi:HD-like signal output (HDOD) protein
MAENDGGADPKTGDALNEQRFRMLEDIAIELAGEVVFPTSFNTTLKLRQQLQDAELPVSRIERLVGVDPLIVARLIKLANSATYARQDPPVRNLPGAIARLGGELVRTTALAIAMTQLLRSKETAAFSDLAHSLWRHSIKSAVAARLLARKYTQFDADDAQLAGLVHDLGALYMLYRVGHYPELAERPETVKFVIMRWHEGIGVSLLHALGMPREIVDAAIDHDHPRAQVPTGLRTFGDIVYVANILAGAHFEWFNQDLDPESMATNVIRETFAEILPELEVETNEMLAVLG